MIILDKGGLSGGVSPGMGRNGHAGTRIGMTGGGGGGGSRNYTSDVSISGSGSDGSAAAAGTGGGASDDLGYIGRNTLYDGELDGGSGGRGRSNLNQNITAGGGAGNPVGLGYRNGVPYPSSNAEEGTGGMLCIIVKNIVGAGYIFNLGCDGGNGIAGGGGSGGGSVTLRYVSSFTFAGTINTSGGRGGNGDNKGGDGGMGFISVQRI